jgi:hypothetical protein
MGTKDVRTAILAHFNKYPLLGHKNVTYSRLCNLTLRVKNGCYVTKTKYGIAFCKTRAYFTAATLIIAVKYGAALPYGMLKNSLYAGNPYSGARSTLHRSFLSRFSYHSSYEKSQGGDRMLLILGLMYYTVTT